MGMRDGRTARERIYKVHRQPHSTGSLAVMVVGSVWTQQGYTGDVETRKGVAADPQSLFDRRSRQIPDSVDRRHTGC